MTMDVSSQSVIVFTIAHEHGRVTAVSTNLPELNHFLDLLQNNRAYNTWVSYAHDLQIFFRTIDKPPEAVTRGDVAAYSVVCSTRVLCGPQVIRRMAYGRGGSGGVQGVP